MGEAHGYGGAGVGKVLDIVLYLGGGVVAHEEVDADGGRAFGGDPGGGVFEEFE